MTESPTRRQQIRDLLELLASEQRQLEYERKVPHVNITDELVCMWFNDHIYDTHDIADDKTFTELERRELLRFHEYYDARVKLLPDSNGTVRTWHADPVWREIMNAAQSTLQRLAA